MTEKELKKILENHKHWLQKDCYDWEGMKANLSGTDLSSAILKSANLSGAYLGYANLYKADLTGVKNVPYTPMVCPKCVLRMKYLDKISIWVCMDCEYEEE